MRPLVPLAIALAVMLTPAAASATQHKTVRVSYADLNLATSQGRATFDRRMTAAIRHICPYAEVRELRASARARACAADARASLAPLMASVVAKSGTVLAAVE